MAEQEANSFDEAASRASKELEQIKSKMNPQQLEGAKAIAEWWDKWYMTAGHKRLGRIIKNS